MSQQQTVKCLWCFRRPVCYEGARFCGAGCSAASEMASGYRLGGAGGYFVEAHGLSRRTLMTVSLKSDDGNVNLTFPLADPETPRLIRAAVDALDVTDSNRKYLLNLCRQAHAGRALS